MNRFAFNKILLLGDAVHATTPNIGQGAGQAIEDAPTKRSEVSGRRNMKINLLFMSH
ncbi:FAD-dependent monooxygenase [Neobacillus sp. GCM10023253]